MLLYILFIINIILNYVLLDRSMLLYVHRDGTDCKGRGTQDIHLDSHTAPELKCFAFLTSAILKELNLRKFVCVYLIDFFSPLKRNK